jgi:hypothetical protein
VLLVVVAVVLLEQALQIQILVAMEVVVGVQVRVLLLGHLMHY